MGDINVIGSFDWDPPLKNSQQEVQLMIENKWEPGSKDFEAVAGKSILCKSFLQFLGVILNQKPKSVGRINVFTHGNSDLIAFKGRLVPRTTMTDVMLELSQGLDLKALDMQALDLINDTNRWFQVERNPTKYTITDIRSRFTDNAIIFFYSCHSGLDSQFLQAIANTFQIMVDGFKPAIAYCPKYSGNPPLIDRKHIGIKDCSVYQTTNFYELAPYAASKNLIISTRPIRR